MALPTLFEQLSIVSTQPHALAQRRFNPRPAGVLRKWSASDAVFSTLMQHGGFKTEAQIRWMTGLSHSKVSWALLYLRRNGFVDAVPDEVRCNRYMRYRAIKKGV